jgi:serine/threonine protein kinase
VFEKPNAPRSRSYDTWSLGCIFLEFAIWYLFDFNAVMAFQSARESGRAAYDNPGYFYKQMDDRSVAAHSQVTEAISFLLEDPRCSPGTSFESLIRLISDGLLQLDFKQRPKADAVVTRLQEIVSRMVGSKSLAKNRVAMSKPFVFQQQTSKHGPKDSVMNTSTFA